MNDDRSLPVKVVHRQELDLARADGELATAPRQAGPLAQAHALLRGRYHWAVLLGLALAGVGTYLGYRLPPVRYQSSGLIRILPSKQRILYQSEQNSVMPMFDSFVQSQVELIKSPRVLDYAMQNADWQHLARGMSPKQVSKFREAVEVEHPRNSEVILISFTDADPDAATVGARAVVQAYQKLYGENDVDNPAHALVVLEERRTALGNELRSFNERVIAIATEFGSDSLDPIYSAKLEEVNGIEREIQQAQLLLASVDARAGEGAQAGGTTRPAARPALTAEQIEPFDPDMRDLLHKRRDQQEAAERLERRYGAKYPAVIDARATLESLDEQITDRLERFASSDQPDRAASPATQNGAALTIAGVRVRKVNLEQLWAKAHDELLNIGRKNLRIKELQSQAEEVRRRLTETASRIEHLNIESSANSRFIVISDGDKPLEPYNDKRIAASAGGGAGGLALGVGAILALGLVNRRFRNVDDAKVINPGMRLLGILPELPRQITSREEAATAAHCLHHIRTALQIHRNGPDESVYAITSPAPGAGKTSTALALGLSFAASKSKTLLIDCDVVGAGLTRRLKKTCHRRIGHILTREGLITEEQVAQALQVAHRYGKRLGEVLVKLGWLSQADVDHALTVQSQTQLGLLDVLAGEPLSECITGTGIPGLFVLPLGDASELHVGQLSPQAVRAIVKAARLEYDAILIDTGPLLGSLEASIVAAEADKVVLVLSKGASQSVARRAVAQLESLGARPAGIVFNRASPEDVVHSGYSSARSTSSPVRSRTQVHTIALDDGMHVGPLGSAVASSTAAQVNQPPGVK